MGILCSAMLWEKVSNNEGNHSKYKNVRMCDGRKKLASLLAERCHVTWILYGNLSERLRRWSKKLDVVGSIPVTTEFFLISCDSNQVPTLSGLEPTIIWRSHYNISKIVLWCREVGV